MVGSEAGEMKQPEGGPPNPPSEQEEGAAVLDAAAPQTEAAKRSQSAIAAEIAEQAGTNKPLN